MRTERATWSDNPLALCDRVLISLYTTETVEAVLAQMDAGLEAGKILKARETQRKKDALAEIRRIAKAHKLDVAVTRRPRRRGRPPKESSGL